MNEICKEIPQQYQVNVIVLEGRHLALKYTNTKVVISIGKKKKTIHAKSNKTDSPYYNDFCVFNFFLPLNVLLDKILTVKVFQKTIIIKKKFIGGFKLDLATVWAQPNHQFYHKWAVLENTKNPRLGVRGFLKCDIAILSKNVIIRVPVDQEGNEAVEDNILAPYGGIKDRLRTQIVCSVYRADSFSPYYKTRIKPKVSKPYIKITYSGNVKRTKIAKGKKPPVWNEEVVFYDLFPPLSQNILIEICDRRKSKKSRSLANTKLDIRSLYEDGENGFLPTFGPNFVYLYQPFKKSHHYRDICTLQNSFTYFCRLLFAIRTETLDNPENIKVQKKKKKSSMTSIPPILESNYFEYDRFILFAAIFDVLLFESNYTRKNVRIRLTVGPKKTSPAMQPGKKPKKQPKMVQFPTGLEPPKTLNVLTTCNTTRPIRCNTQNDYSFLAFSGRFPCVFVYGEWPDTIRRIYQSNIIKKAIQNCTKEVNQIKYDLQFDDKKQSEFSKKLKHTLAELSKSCEVILLLTKVTKGGDTNLFRERKRVNRREIADIAKKTKIASRKKALKAEEELGNISNYLERLAKFAQDPENSFPDTEVWLLKGKKLIAQCTIKTEDVAFSSNIYEKGILSGKPQTIVIRGKKDNITAKMDIFIWFGLAENFMKCLEMLPGGFRHEHSPCSTSIAWKIPSEIIYEESHRFQCRAHIFQAGITFGFDDTGLADCFVRVIVLGQSRKTQVRKETLSPIWDETLIFPQVTLYGPSQYIKTNSITITVEVFDQDTARSSELIGRTFVIPAVKLKDDEYSPPLFPPKLKWETLTSEYKEAGRVLMVVELLELSDNLRNIYPFHPSQKGPLSIPPDIRPRPVKYRLEIIFWGVRQLPKKKYLKNKVFVIIESAERLIKSPLLHNVKHKMNFPFSIQFEEIELPAESEYAPPLSVKLYHISSISRRRMYVANCIVPSIRQFYVSLLKESERADEEEIHIRITKEEKNKKTLAKKKKKVKEKWTKRKEQLEEYRETCLLYCVKLWRYVKCKVFRKCTDSAYELKPGKNDEKLTWWVKYYASTEGAQQYPGISPITVYQEELEAQPQFKGFLDYLYNFEMVTGNERKTKKRNVKGKVKAALKLYRIPADSNELKGPNRKVFEEGLLAKSPTNTPERVIVRVYVVGAKNLAPRDIYGKSDPYLFVQVGKHTISDRHHYSPKQVNPTFGKCFEFKATFPEDYLLQVKVIDYDKVSRDDLIGETTIDVENRYYSKYHASCGISKVFETEGYNAWRDIYSPSKILQIVCERSALQPPVIEDNEVVIEGHKFATRAPPGVNKKENQALQVLNRWHELPLRGFHLVPEHVETRPLYHPALPGIEQGKLIMWVDIFPADYRFLPPKVDITPQSPEPMELRAIVWNVDDVVLDDTSLIFRDKMSDIYVRGWILSLEEEMQKTDIHFRSLDGEGNFNWRFIFHFNYIPSEGRMMVKKKIDAFDLQPEERKLRCKLEIQIWDNDAFGDDYLGTLILELCAMPKGAKLASRCTLKMLAPNAAKINLFKIRRTRGWWPFRRHKENQRFGSEFDLTGKIDLELEVLTEAEAKLSPAGKGRDEPDPLPPPNRPVTSFNWMLNPGKVLRYIIWRKIGRCLIITLVILIILLFILTALYSFPNYLVKKMLRA